MKNGDGDYMATVGYEPWVVSITLIDPVMTGSTNPTIEGTTLATFVHGDGRATFEDITVTGDLSSAKFEFKISDPSSNTIASVKSSVIEFLPAVNRGPCEEDEGTSFDKKQSWSANCDFVCLASCFDLSGIATIPPVCSAAANCDASTYTTCNSGCKCDETVLPVKPNYIDHATTTCSTTGMEIRFNKCIVNMFNDIRLKDLYMGGNLPLADGFVLDSDNENNCRGSLSYDHGVEYSLTLAKPFTACGTVADDQGATVIYTNSVQGYPAAKVLPYLITFINDVFLEQYFCHIWMYMHKG